MAPWSGAAVPLIPSYRRHRQTDVYANISVPVKVHHIMYSQNTTCKNISYSSSSRLQLQSGCSHLDIVLSARPSRHNGRKRLPGHVLGCRTVAYSTALYPGLPSQAHPTLTCTSFIILHHSAKHYYYYHYITSNYINLCSSQTITLVFL